MTEERPVLDKTLNSKTFQEFYYTKMNCWIFAEKTRFQHPVEN